MRRASIDINQSGPDDDEGNETVQCVSLVWADWRWVPVVKVRPRPFFPGGGGGGSQQAGAREKERVPPAAPVKAAPQAVCATCGALQNGYTSHG